MAADQQNLVNSRQKFNRFDWNAAPEPWNDIGLAWRAFCERQAATGWAAPPPSPVRPCKYGHPPGRYPSSGKCKVCVRLAYARWVARR